MLVRNPKADRDGCRILYRDIGDYLTREQKLAFLQEKGSIMGIDDWEEIAPDRHYDWIGKRSEEFGNLYPIGSKDAKAGKTEEAIFKLFSNGYKTNRDAYIYNFSRDECARNARMMVDDYSDALEELKEIEKTRTRSNQQFDKLAFEVSKRYSDNLKWDLNLRNNLKRKKDIIYKSEKIIMANYRPLCTAELLC